MISLFGSDANVAGVFCVYVCAGSNNIQVSIIHHVFNVQVCVCMYPLSKFTVSSSYCYVSCIPAPGLNEVQAVMDKFKDRFLEHVDSSAIVRRLEIEGAISPQCAHSIRQLSSQEGTEEMFLYLRTHVDLENMNKLCDVMIGREGYPNMIQLGRDVKEELTSR